MDIKLAVLIDGDNIPSAYVKEMMEEIAKYGVPTFKRIYADWTKPHVARWKELLLEHGADPNGMVESSGTPMCHTRPRSSAGGGRSSIRQAA